MTEYLPPSPYNKLAPAIHNFTGRQKTLQDIDNHFKTRFNIPVVLVGQRRIGKTSLLNAIQRRENSNILISSLSLQAQTTAELADTLAELAAQIAIHHELDLSSIACNTAYEFIHDFTPRLNNSLERLDKLMLILFDEVDSLDIQHQLLKDGNSAFDLLPILERIRSKVPRLSFVLVTGKPISSLSERFRSSFLSESLYINIGRLDRLENDTLVTNPAKGYLDYTSDALDRLFYWTAGQPCFTQIMCSVLWGMYAHETNLEIPITVTSSDIDKVLKESLVRASTALTSIYDDWPALHKVVLSTITSETNNTDNFVSIFTLFIRLTENQVYANENNIRAAIYELADWDLIEFSKNREYIKVIPKILAYHINRHKNIHIITDTIKSIYPIATTYIDDAIEDLEKKNYAEAIKSFEKIDTEGSVSLYITKTKYLIETYADWAISENEEKKIIEWLANASLYAVDLLKMRPIYWDKSIKVLGILKDRLPPDSEERLDLEKKLRLLDEFGRVNTILDSIRSIIARVLSALYSGD